MATLGYTSVGGTDQALSASFVCGFGPWVASENGTITSVSVYTITSGIKITVGVYSDSAGLPVTLIADSDEGDSVAGGWVTLNVSGSLVNGTTYWIGVNTDTGAQIYRYDSDATYAIKFKASTYVAGTLPNPFGSSPSNASSRKMSAYITYTPDAGAAASRPIFRRSTRFFKRGIS